MKRLIERYPVWTVLVLMLVCLSPVMAMRDFSPSNELRYLSIADEAIREGHVFAFTNHGAAYADKPPLYLWIIMLCRLIFGGHCMYVLTLFSFVPAAVTVLVMDRWVYGGRGRGEGEPLWAERSAMALMLCTAGLFLGMSVFLRMDMMMTMFIVLALYAWHKDRPWLFALWTFMALFTKGPVGILMPPLAVLTYIVSGRLVASRRGLTIASTPQMRAGRWLGWRFWTLMAGCCAVWFAGVYIDGGREYLDNLLFHQTVGRAVNSFHHDRPVWYYLVNIWAVLAPWSIAVVPSVVVSLCHRGDTACPEAGVDVETARTEKMFRCAVLCTFVMLSCFSGKLSIYLAPVFPFAVYLLPVMIHRRGWSHWMGWTLAVPSAVVALIGLAVAVVPFVGGRIPALDPYGFVRSPLVTAGGVVLLCGAVLTAVWALRRKSVTACLPLSSAMLLLALVVSPLMPRVNDHIGYAGLCSEVPAGETVYVLKVHRPENMDVYLGREVVKLEGGDPLPSDGVLMTKVSFDDPSLCDRPVRIHGKYKVWLSGQRP